MVLQGLSQDRALPIGLETAEGLLRLQHAGGGPPEGHLRMAPALDVALDDADGSLRVLDDVGAGEGALGIFGQAEPDDGEDLVRPFQDRARDTRRLLLQAPVKQPIDLAA